MISWRTLFWILFALVCVQAFLGCLFTPSPMALATPLTEYEGERLNMIAAKVADCVEIQAFPFIPCATGDTDWAESILVQQLRVIRHHKSFPCADVEWAAGCYNARTNLLQYDVRGKHYPADDILDHELLHALLWVLGDPRHGCSLHDSDKNNVWDCYE